jgi:hypothetical protein
MTLVSSRATPSERRIGPAPAFGGLALTIVVLIGLMSSLSAPARSAPRVCSAAELTSDLRQIRVLLETRHPALYAFTARPTFDSLFGQAQDLVDRPMTSREFFQIAAPIVARVGCGHTTLTMAVDSLTGYADRFLPLRVFVAGERAYVCRTLAAAGDRNDLIPPGAELLTINGVAVPDILTRMRAVISADGGNDGWKTALLNGGALYDLYALLFGFPEAFDLTFRPAADASWARAGAGTASLPAVSRQVVTDLLAKRGANHTTSTGDPRIDFTLTDGAAAAILTIETFAYYNSREKFYAIIDGVFDRLRAAGCHNLILDLRGNSGGDPYCAAHLLAYLAPDPVRYFARVYPSYAPLAEPLTLPEHRFPGNLYTLIDGGCFSTTGHLAALLKFHRIGTFIGSETGGTYECNDAARTDTLKATGLRLRVARATYTVAVENLPRGRGVSPDLAVQPTICDVLSGRDSAMECAWSLVERRLGAALEERREHAACQTSPSPYAPRTAAPAGSFIPRGPRPGQ